MDRRSVIPVSSGVHLALAGLVAMPRVGHCVWCGQKKVKGMAPDLRLAVASTCAGLSVLDSNVIVLAAACYQQAAKHVDVDHRRSMATLCAKMPTHTVVERTHRNCMQALKDFNARLTRAAFRGPGN